MSKGVVPMMIGCLSFRGSHGGRGARKANWRIEIKVDAAVNGKLWYRMFGLCYKVPHVNARTSQGVEMPCQTP